MMRDYELPYNMTAESAMRVYYRNMHIILRQCENEEDPDRLKRLLYDLRVCARKVDMLCTFPPDAVVNPAPGAADLAPGAADLAAGAADLAPGADGQ